MPLPPQCRVKEGGGAKSGFAPTPISAKIWIKRAIFRGALAAARKFSEKSLFSEILPLPNNFTQLRLWGGGRRWLPPSIAS